VLFELVDPSDLHIALTVFEKDLASVQPGQRVNVSAPRDPSKVYEAEVLLVARKLDDDRTAVVHCHFKNGQGDFLPGMFVNAEIEVAKAGACAVPTDAVVRSGEDEFVFVETGPGVFIMTGVKTGISDGGWTELLPAEGELCDRVMITRNAWSALMKLQNKSEE
jgi:membrane fusion protein, heavy metal efflux system